jgi:hypothetical protein
VIRKLELQFEYGLEQTFKHQEIRLRLFVLVPSVLQRTGNSEALVAHYFFLLAINIKRRLLHASNQTPLS